MVVLKKIKASTLLETLVATVLIVVLFMMASGVLNNLLQQNRGQHEEQLHNRLMELQYQYRYGAISSPYYEEYSPWEIEGSIEEIAGENYFVLEGVHTSNKRIVTVKIPHEN